MEQIRTKDKCGFLERTADWYFTPREFERENHGEFYRKLGVRVFKKIVPTFGDYVNRGIRCVFPSYRVISKKSDAKIWKGATITYEAFHLIGAGVLGCFMFDNVIDGDFSRAGMQLAGNIVLDFYPIMLQRYNGARIENVLNRSKK